MAWIESHQSLGSHPKLLRLASLLGIRPAQAIGHLMYLWWWALDYADDGDITKYSDDEISLAAHWEGPGHDFSSAMRKCGWVEMPGVLHDWLDYAGQFLLGRERQKRYRANKQANSDNKRNGDVTDDVTVTSRVTTTVPYSTIPYHTIPNHTKKTDGVAAGATAVKEPTDYQRAVEHILASYALGPGKGTKYPFAGKDGRAVKRLLGLYGFPDLIALWDEFLVTKWDWVNSMNKTVTVPRNLQVFESKLTDLIERGTYKKRLYSQDEKEGAKPGMQSIDKVLGGVIGGLH